MFHDVDNFSGRIRIRNQTLVGHISQLAESFHQLEYYVFVHVRSVLLQKLNLVLDARIVDRVRAEEIAQSSEKVVPQEWKTGPVCQYYYPKVRVKRYGI